MARRRKPLPPKDKWIFYVYDIVIDGITAYVGKGSGRRVNTQARNKSGEGVKVALFFDEDVAYRYERDRIRELNPYLNSHPGGNGSRKKKPRRPKKFKEITQREVALFLLSKDISPYVDESTIEKIRGVAYG
jgi:hypothetical protein